MTLSTSTVTLAPGSSRTYSLAPGEAVTVATEPNCYVTVTETPDVISSADLDGQTNVRTSILQYKGEWTYGPYALGGTVVVDVSLAKSTSSVSATLGSAAAAVVGAAAVVTTWANRAQAQAARFAFFSDIGIGGGSYWYYTGGRWRPYGGRVTLKSLTADVSNNGAPKVVMDYATILAGVWQDGDILVANIVKERTGGTSDTDATDVLLGTAPTTLGTTLNLSTSSLATTTISLALEYKWRRVSSTSVRSQSVAGAVGLGSSTSANSLITGLPNLDNTGTYLQVSSDLTTAGGEVAWLRGYTVTLIAGA